MVDSGKKERRKSAGKEKAINLNIAQRMDGRAMKRICAKVTILVTKYVHLHSTMSVRCVLLVRDAVLSRNFNGTLTNNS